MVARGDQVSGLDEEEIIEIVEVMMSNSRCGPMLAVYRALRGRGLMLENSTASSAATLLRRYRIPEDMAYGEMSQGSQITAATRFVARIDLGAPP